MTDDQEHAHRRHERPERRRADDDQYADLRTLNNPSAWDGLPLDQQSAEQLAGNLAYKRQQLADYRATYGGTHSDNEDPAPTDSYQEAEIKARIRDIKAEQAKKQ